MRRSFKYSPPLSDETQVKTSVTRSTPIWILLLLLFPLCGALSGCASLFGRQLSDEEQLAESDPVAAAALKLRHGHLGRSSMAAPAEFEDANDLAEQDHLRLSAARSRQDVVTGMSPDEVRALWGEPREIEHAGLPGSGNERWTYFEGLSSRWSLSTARVIYFEGGRVAGWEVQKP